MKKYVKIIVLVLCLSLVFPFAACSKTLDYKAATLTDGKVGVAYSASVAMEDADGVTYTLKDGSSLPTGLSLNPDGEIKGTPTAKYQSKIFTVIAEGKGYKSAEAEFTVTIKEGALVFNTELPRVALGNKYSAKFSVIGAGGAVSYKLAEGDQLPTGLTFNNGEISGTPTVSGEEKTFNVTAECADCAPATKAFTLKVILPWLTYTGRTLANGRENEFYTANLASATGTNNKITYTLKEGSTPPSGLTLSTSGLLSGTPTQRVVRHAFTVLASAENFTSGEAEFIITISQGEIIEDPGKITYNSKTIPTVYVGETVFIEEAVKSASSDNRATVSYALSPESTLPGGLVILPNGGLYSETALTAAGTFTFKVVASAQGCDPVTAEFSLTIAPAKLIFKGFKIDTASVGEQYSYSVATALTPDGGSATIKYTLKTGSLMPQGLTLSENGMVTGTPEKAVKVAYFTVIASAAGYTSVADDMSLKIQNAIEYGVTRFEAEYMDLTGITGGGYSGSASEEGMIQPNTNEANPSNGYFVGFTHGAVKFTYKITSNKAVNGGVTFTIGLDSEIGSVTFNNSNFDIRLNGKSINYSITITVPDNGSTFNEFKGYQISTNESLKEGENIVELEVLDNELMGGGRTGGPGIDYIEFGNLSGASLSWRPCRYNLS